MFIAIEGIDGSGKHTQTQLLQRRFEAAGYSAGALSFPRYGETQISLSIAEYLNGVFGELDTMPAHFPALLYAIDRYESRALIEELTGEKDIVLSDRYVSSNLAHQGAKLRLENRERFIVWLEQVEYVIFDLPRPDLTLFLDVPVDVAVDLIATKKPRDYTEAEADIHEKDRVYLTACREVYQTLCSSEKYGTWVSVSCVGPAGKMRTVSDIHEEVWESAQQFLEKEKA